MSSVDRELKPQSCTRCRAINLECLFDPLFAIAPSGTHIAKLGKPSSRSFTKECPSCQLLLSVAPLYKRKHSLELRLFDAFRQSGDEKSENADRFLAVLRQNIRLVYDEKTIHEVGSGGLLIASRDGVSDAGVHQINAQKPDYDTIKTWINHCETNHTNCERLPGSEAVHSLRVIDCQNYQIVPLQREARYVALSYVWGTFVGSEDAPDNADSATSRTGLPTALPRTIKDAIVVVRHLGYQYLWVDRYCLPQEGNDERHDAISNMNSIYAQASLTIVATFGDDSNAGLPGVSTISRSTQQTALLGAFEVTSTFPPLSTVLQNAPWSSRAWTYQEARLSKRCLFFTEHQVYFSCSQMSCSEALPDVTVSSNVLKRLNNATLSGYTLAKQDKNLNLGLILDRYMYSQRSLTYKTDGLDAFRGILRLHPYTTLWGVPIHREGLNLDPDVGFGMGLLWTRQPEWATDRHLRDKTAERYQRRPGFPTWSWASIDGHIYQDIFKAQGTMYWCFVDQLQPNSYEAGNGMHPSINVKIKVDDDKFMPLNEVIKLVQEGALRNMLPEISQTIFVEGDVVKVKRAESTISASTFYACAADGTALKGSGSGWTRFDLECDVDGIQQEAAKTTEVKDALVIVEWEDTQHKSNARFVLMLLHWVSEDVAERVGLLGEYYIPRQKKFIATVPRTRKRFYLQ